MTNVTKNVKIVVSMSMIWMAFLQTILLEH